MLFFNELLELFRSIILDEFIDIFVLYYHVWSHLCSR